LLHKTSTGANRRTAKPEIKSESIINQFEALIQKLTKSNGTDLSERARAEYVQLCKDAVNSLEQEIKAES
jgi:geranylgeranyl pyrophosphate synthase